VCGNPLGVVALISKNDQGPSADVPLEAEEAEPAEPAEPLSALPPEPEAERPSAEDIRGQSLAGESARPSSEAVPPEALGTAPDVDKETTSAETTHTDEAPAPASAHDPVQSSDDPPLAAAPQETIQPTPETELRMASSAAEHPATTTPKASSSRTRTRSSSTAAPKTPRDTQEIELEKQVAPVRAEHVEILADQPRRRRSLSFKTRLSRVFKGRFRPDSPESTPSSKASGVKAKDSSKSRVRRAFKQGIEVVMQRRPKVPRLRRGMFNIRHLVRQSARMR
jgi:hypothetical protein